MRKTALFACTLFAQKVRFCSLLGALSGIGGNSTFRADKLFGDFGSVARTEILKTKSSRRRQGKFIKWTRGGHEDFAPTVRQNNT